MRIGVHARRLQSLIIDRTPSTAVDIAVFGGGFGYSAYMISTDQQARGFRFAAVNSALLAAVMGARFYRTGKPMPALPLAVAGLASLGYHGYKYSEWADWE